HRQEPLGAAAELATELARLALAEAAELTAAEALAELTAAEALAELTAAEALAELTAAAHLLQGVANRRADPLADHLAPAFTNGGGEPFRKRAGQPFAQRVDQSLGHRPDDADLLPELALYQRRAKCLAEPFADRILHPLADHRFEPLADG